LRLCVVLFVCFGITNRLMIDGWMDGWVECAIVLWFRRPCAWVGVASQLIFEFDGFELTGRPRLHALYALCGRSTRLQTAGTHCPERCAGRLSAALRSGHLQPLHLQTGSGAGLCVLFAVVLAAARFVTLTHSLVCVCVCVMVRNMRIDLHFAGEFVCSFGGGDRA
jgi:hypothetical protein